MTHALLAGSLPRDQYFRLNPFLSEVYNLDECRAESLTAIQNDAKRYAELNSEKLQEVATKLKRKRPFTKQISDKVKESWLPLASQVSFDAANFWRKEQSPRDKLGQMKSPPTNPPQPQPTSTTNPTTTTTSSTPQQSVVKFATSTAIFRRWLMM